LDNDSRFDFGDMDDALDPNRELEPMSLQEASEIFCAADMSESDRTEWRAELAEQLGVEMTIRVECENCHELIRRSHFNSDVVWVHEPEFRGPWPNTRCKTGGKAIPVFSQLLTEDDKSFLEEARIKYE
jgi:hypothetical protein